MPVIALARSPGSMTNLRTQVFPEGVLPDPTTLVQHGREAARSIKLGPSPFLEHYEVSSECEYKRKQIHLGHIMRHAQIGYRSLHRSCRAYAEIYHRLEDNECTLDRYGICLDWSMGYPQAQRQRRPRGTGLILDSTESFLELTAQAPVAPHFGDFVLGMPAAYENTCAALSAGSTSIGNLGQYFTFRLPQWHDDVFITAQTIKAISLCAAQPIPVLIHSNLDDGFAALFTDLACALGAVLLERYIVDDLLGGTASHCYGHTYSEPLARLAFQRALAQISDTPGTMVYGNTTLYGRVTASNYAGLGSYLLIDILAQMRRPSGHAVNPVPVSEAYRIPDIEEIVDAHLFAHKLIERAAGMNTLLNTEEADIAVEKILNGAKQFKNKVMAGLDKGGIDINNPLEMLLAIRRLGPRFLEENYGPGKVDPARPHGRKAIFLATTISDLEQQASACVNALTDKQRKSLSTIGLRVCVTTTDVHEYGKLLVEAVLTRLEISTIDGGVCTDPEDLVGRVRTQEANVIAISTYNGVALDYLRNLKGHLSKNNLERVSIYIGGKLNQIVESNAMQNDLPIDVSQQLSEAGAIPCHEMRDMLLHLLQPE